MAPIRKLVSVLIVGASTIAFVGVAFALGGNGPELGTTGPGAAIVHGRAVGPDSSGTDGVDGATGDREGDEPSPATTEAEGTEDDETDPGSPAEHPVNHGAVVSEAAHSCPAGPEHGACVSEVARGGASKPADRTHGQDDDHDDEGNAGGPDGRSKGASHRPEGKGEGRGRQ